MGGNLQQIDFRALRPGFRAPAWAMLALAMVLALMLPLANSESAHAASLPQRLSQAVRGSGVAGVSSVVVYNSDSRRVIYMYNGRELVAPASNQKLLTAAGVLHGLGPNQRLKTQVAIVGRQVGRELRGHVYLIGGGDPTLSTPYFRRKWYGGDGGRLHAPGCVLADHPAEREAGAGGGGVVPLHVRVE